MTHALLLHQDTETHRRQHPFKRSSLENTLSSQTTGKNQSQDSSSGKCQAEGTWQRVLATVSAAEKFYDFILKHPNFIFIVRSLSHTFSLYPSAQLSAWTGLFIRF